MLKILNKVGSDNISTKWFQNVDNVCKRDNWNKPVIEHCAETGIDLWAPLGPLILLDVKEVAESLNVPTVSLPPHIFSQLGPVVGAQDKQNTVLEAFLWGLTPVCWKNPTLWHQLSLKPAH